MGTHPIVLSKSYPMDTNITGFRCALDKSIVSIRRVKAGYGTYLSIQPRFEVRGWKPHSQQHILIPFSNRRKYQGIKYQRICLTLGIQIAERISEVKVSYSFQFWLYYKVI